MKLALNIFKYTLGLPILLFVTFYKLVDLILDPYFIVVNRKIEELKELWRPIK